MWYRFHAAGKFVYASAWKLVFGMFLAGKLFVVFGAICVDSNVAYGAIGLKHCGDGGVDGGIAMLSIGGVMACCAGFAIAGACALVLHTRYLAPPCSTMCSLTRPCPPSPACATPYTLYSNATRLCNGGKSATASQQRRRQAFCRLSTACMLHDVAAAHLRLMVRLLARRSPHCPSPASFPFATLHPCAGTLTGAIFPYSFACQVLDKLE